MALIIRPDGTVEERTFAEGETFTLDEIHSLLKEGGAATGYMQTVPVRDGRRIMLVNEDGIRYKLPRNNLATALVNFATPREIVRFIKEVKLKGVKVQVDPAVLHQQDYIKGTAIVCTLAEMG